MAERIRKTVEAMKVPLKNGEELRVTLSVGGVFVDDPEEIEEPADLMTTADRLLYQCKRAGRNCSRVTALEDPDHE